MTLNRTPYLDDIREELFLDPTGKIGVVYSSQYCHFQCIDCEELLEKKAISWKCPSCEYEMTFKEANFFCESIIKKIKGLIIPVEVVVSNGKSGFWSWVLGLLSIGQRKRSS